VTPSNDAWCFGNPTLRGAPPTASTSPTQVTGAGIWRMVTGGLTVGLSGTTHRCGVTTSDTVACWGGNTHGELGTGNTTSSVLPVPVESPERFSTVAVDGAESCALSLDQRLFCWGGGRTTPTSMSASLRFTALSVSASAASGVCAVGTDGLRYCRDSDWRMVNLSPAPLFRSLSSGPNHHCGIRQDGIAVCWLDNTQGQLGTGDLASRSLPTAVVGQ
jgi:alpha-tubulin suppressor-like RCC1 family protein